MWAGQVAPLAANGRRVVSIDLRGHGESARAGAPFTIAQMCDDVTHVLDELSIERAYVCGHSLGGMVAQTLALRQPSRVSGMALLDATYGLRSTASDAFVLAFTNAILRLSTVEWQAELFARSLTRYTPLDCADAVRAYVQHEMATHIADPDNYRAIWRAISEFDSRARLHEIACPVTIFVGELNPRTHAQPREMARRMSNATLVTISDAASLVNLENSIVFEVELLKAIAYA